MVYKIKKQFKKWSFLFQFKIIFFFDIRNEKVGKFHIEMYFYTWFFNDQNMNFELFEVMSPFFWLFQKNFERPPCGYSNKSSQRPLSKDIISSIFFFDMLKFNNKIMLTKLVLLDWRKCCFKKIDFWKVWLILIKNSNLNRITKFDHRRFAHYGATCILRIPLETAGWRERG